MKNLIYTLGALAPLLVGCSSIQRPVLDAAFGAGGGLLASELSNGDPAVTAAGAVGGVAVAEGLQWMKRKGEKESYLRGYERGQGAAVKATYWRLVEGQKEGQSAPSYRLYEVEIPEHYEDGVLVKSSRRTIRIEE